MFPSRRITSCSGDKFRDEYSLAFDGSDDHIKIPSTGDSVHDANFSYLFWAKRNVTDAIHNILGDTASGANYIRFSTTGLLSIETNSSGDQADGTLVSNDTAWHYYAVVISGGNGTCQMYQDGVALSMTNPDLEADLKYRHIGGQGSDGTSSSFNGNISEIAVYNIALTSSQVATIYNGREPYNHKEGVCSSNLQAWWRMGDGDLDNFNLIADQTNATKQTDLMTSDWDTQFSENNVDSNNTVTYPTATSVRIATTDGAAIGINDADLLTADSVYNCVIDITVHSGVGGRMQGNATVHQQMATTGIYNFSFIAEDTHFSIYRRTASASDFTINNIIIQEVNGNAGFMLNMDADDFEGDTP